MLIFWGMHYLAKKNLRREQGTCAQCGNRATLSSFDAFKFFHLYFIPIIPLGRVHVSDQCSSCKRHYETKLVEWERARDEALQTIKDHYLTDPLNFEWAAEALQLTWSFGTRAQTEVIVTQIEETFAERVEAKAILAQWYDAQGDRGRVEQLIAEIDAAAGDSHAEDGEDAGDSPAAVPPVATAAAPRSPANPPPTGGGPLKVVMITGAAAVALVVLAVGANEALKRSQTLYVLNGTASIARVEAAGGKVLLDARSKGALDIGEGKHVVAVHLDNGHSYEREIDVQNTWLQRFSTNNAFVFNVLGADAFFWEEIIYTTSTGADAEGQSMLLAGREFYSFHGVAYPFRTPPEEIRTESSQVVRNALARLDAEPIDLLGAIYETPLDYPKVDAMAFAAGQLVGGQRDDEMINAYLYFSEEADQMDEALTLLDALGIEVTEEAPAQ